MPFTVLIVDDHDQFRAYASELLAAEGFDIVGEAADGAAAIAAARELEPAVVLLDVALPDLDGFAVCERIVAANPAPIVVLTSSSDAASFRRRLRASPARGFIGKSELSGALLAEMVE